MLLPDAIAIIIVTFHNAGEIARCLHSLAQAEPERNIYLFLIDNASTDGTREIIQTLITRLPKPRFNVEFILNEKNLGFTSALNQGLTRYFAMRANLSLPVLFLNPDTVLPANSLPALLEKLYAMPDTGVVAPQLIYEDGRIQASCRRFPTHWDLFCELAGLSRLFPDSQRWNRWKMGDFDHRTAAEVDQPQGACLLARPETAAQAGLWDECFPIFFSDVDWCRRVWQKGWKIRFEPSVQIIHAQGVSVQQVRASAIWGSHLSFWRYLRKNERNWREKSLNWICGPLLIVAACVRLMAHWAKLVKRGFHSMVA
ncbi:glycosyltransferase family 2 protein [candidate division KSB1 bacterium]|nr:glycosyltransferase family 2 protein [candidate division KSB1 bacterium]